MKLTDKRKVPVVPIVAGRIETVSEEDIFPLESIVK